MSIVFVKSTLREKRLEFMSGFKSSNIQEPKLETFSLQCNPEMSEI